MPSSGNHGLCAVHKRVVGLIQELKHDRKFLLIENLYISRTLAKLAYKEKALIHGVESIHQQNVLKQVVQKEKKSKKDKEEIFVTIKAYIIDDGDKLPRHLACGIYYTNLVHILSTVT